MFTATSLTQHLLHHSPVTIWYIAPYTAYIYSPFGGSILNGNRLGEPSPKEH